MKAVVAPSRGLLRDCTTSPINRFAALKLTSDWLQGGGGGQVRRHAGGAGRAEAGAQGGGGGHF